MAPVTFICVANKYNRPMRKSFRSILSHWSSVDWSLFETTGRFTLVNG